MAGQLCELDCYPEGTWQFFSGKVVCMESLGVFCEVSIFLRIVHTCKKYSRSLAAAVI